MTRIRHDDDDDDDDDDDREFMTKISRLRLNQTSPFCLAFFFNFFFSTQATRSHQSVIGFCVWWMGFLNFFLDFDENKI